MPRCPPGLGTAKWKHVAAAGFIGWTAYATQAQQLDLPNLDLPILLPKWEHDFSLRTGAGYRDNVGLASQSPKERSEEHTSELQSPCNLVCRLLLEKKK